MYHPALGMNPLTPMPLRQWDVLHIIYLYLERHGHKAASVDQIWALDQSLVRRSHRGETLSVETLQGKPPTVPGLRWRHPLRPPICCSPCLLPRSRLFHNRSRSFIPASGMMQLNGIILGACPSWRQFPDAVLASGAGNAFSMTVAAAHLVVAVMRLFRILCPGVEWINKAGIEQKHLPEFALQHIVQFYVKRARVSLVCSDTAASATSVASAACNTIRFGSLCSGTDFVAALMPCIVQAIRDLNRANSPEMHCKQEFSAEIDARMRDFSASNFAPALNVYTDVNKLPRSIPEVHLLIFGSSCRGLSWMNTKRRCLGHQDANNPLHTSGATMAGCLEYVRHRRPRVLLLENVRGLLAVSAVLSQPGRPVRNIDHVMSTLKSLGYTCGYTCVDSRKFLLPQSRPRIWVWAEHGGGDEAQQFWTRLLARMQSTGTFSVESLLVH